MITIVGLGPSGSDHISVGAYESIRNAPIVFVRTKHHPAVYDLEAAGISLRSMDAFYDSAEAFDEVYTAIADCIIKEAKLHDVVYAVPGHPLIGEISVEKIINLAKIEGLEYRILGSESFIEASMAAIEVTLDTGLKIIDALSMNDIKPDTNVGNLIYQVYSREIASDVKLVLMDHYPDDFAVKAVVGAGTSEQEVVEMPLYRLDRRDWNHLTTVYVPPYRPNKD